MADQFSSPKLTPQVVGGGPSPAGRSMLSASDDATGSSPPKSSAGRFIVEFQDYMRGVAKAEVSRNVRRTQPPVISNIFVERPDCLHGCSPDSARARSRYWESREDDRLRKRNLYVRPAASAPQVRNATGVAARPSVTAMNAASLGSPAGPSSYPVRHPLGCGESPVAYNLNAFQHNPALVEAAASHPARAEPRSPESAQPFLKRRFDRCSPPRAPVRADEDAMSTSAGAGPSYDLHHKWEYASGHGPKQGTSPARDRAEDPLYFPRMPLAVHNILKSKNVRNKTVLEAAVDPVLKNALTVRAHDWRRIRNDLQGAIEEERRTQHAVQEQVRALKTSLLDY